MSKMRFIVVSMLAVFAVSAVAVASASAQEAQPHFFICGKKANSLYENSLCTKDVAGTGEWELSELPLAKLLAETSANVAGTKYTLTSEALGIQVTIICSAESGTGWIENPAGGGPGIDLTVNSFSTCEVTKPSGCTVTQPIVATSKTELAELGGAFWDVFTPDGGTTFVEVELKTCGLLSQKFKVTGKTAGKVHNETGIISFSSEMNELKFAGNPAGFEGQSLVLTDGGGTTQVLLTLN
jgi:hypothetical protein